ncbi:EndoU domain-containing protein [Aureimonas jatrophae]|uniref:EndoU nuclease n=1 Tax=Aureimonas jatrophae TaxID=1166073 RepID=A0A1H0D3C7_9HYPH|nr:EndoU domain-containing protein [Aureimonas jatrophae]MBB3951688.1 hypothetical protein [Aureimonas jatrophae]SDN64662.1 EndoU nuclease [Aureimonas jatrophae]
MSVAALPFVAGGPPGWVIAGVITLAGIGLYAVSQSGESVETETEPLDTEKEREEACRNCRKDKNGNDIIPEDRAKHILDGDKSGGGHRAGTGKPGKTEFPTDWSDDDILDGVADVAQNGQTVRPAHRPGEAVKGGTVRDVDIEVVVKPDGSVRTGYPTGGRGVVRNPK